jgi:hypothetical protein
VSSLTTEVQPPKSPFGGLKRGSNYCIKGITSGYLKSSPFGALTLAIITQITFSVPINIIIGIPIMMKHKGIVRTM